MNRKIVQRTSEFSSARCHTRHLAGYTLIELLIVVSLFGLLVGYSIPSFLEFSRKADIIKNVTQVIDTHSTAQALAESGIQSSGSKLGAYRVQLLPFSGDPAGYYRGYRLMRVDEADSTIEPALEQQILDCGLCISSNTEFIDFTIPNGNPQLAGSSQSLRVCSPDRGYYDVTFDNAGRIERSGFQSGASLCTCATVCGDPTVPSPTTTPLATPTPTITPTLSPTPTASPSVTPTLTTTPSPSATPTPSASPTPTATPLPTPTPVSVLVTSAYHADELLWHNSFDSLLTSTTDAYVDVGSALTIHSQTTLYESDFRFARYRKALYVKASNEFLQLRDAQNNGNFNGNAGAMEIWFQPLYDFDDNQQHYIFEGSGTDSLAFTFRKEDNNELHFIIDDASSPFIRYETKQSGLWSAEDWVHLRIEWDESRPTSTQQRVFVNGVEPTHVDDSSDFDGSDFSFGSADIFFTQLNKGDHCDCYLDEVWIYGPSNEPTQIANNGSGGGNDHLNDTGNNYTIQLDAVDSRNRGQYIWVGYPNTFQGINVDLATNGSGSANITWQYWDSNTWNDLSPTGQVNLTNSGAINFTIPGDWEQFSINGSSDLYYIRGRVASGSFSTNPVERRIEIIP